MAHDKIQYWKERMQDNLHTFDTAFTALQKDILDKSTHLGLDRTDIVKALNAIRKDMITLATAIEYAKVPEKKNENTAVK